MDGVELPGLPHTGDHRTVTGMSNPADGYSTDSTAARQAESIGAPAARMLSEATAGPSRGSWMARAGQTSQVTGQDAFTRSRVSLRIRGRSGCIHRPSRAGRNGPPCNYVRRAPMDYYWSSSPANAFHRPTTDDSARFRAESGLRGSAIPPPRRASPPAG